MNTRSQREVEDLICDMLNGAEIEGLGVVTRTDLRSVDPSVIERVSRELKDWNHRAKVRRWLAWREFERRQAALATVGITLHPDFDDVFDELVSERFEVDAHWEDHGIGAYEYGSERGVHHDWGIEARVDGPDTLLIEACLDDYMPPEEETTTHTVTVNVPPRSRRGSEESVEIGVSFRLDSLTMKRETVEIDGECLAFWRIQAELSAGDVSVS